MELANKRVYLLGDSYTTFFGHIPEGYACYYGPSWDTNDVARVEDTWWHSLITETGMELVKNNSFSGSTVSCTHYNGFTNRNNFVGRIRRDLTRGFFEENPVDILLVFGLTNDQWVPAPRGNISFGIHDDTANCQVYPALATLLHLLTENLPKTQIVFVRNTGFDDDMNAAIDTVCGHYRVPVCKLTFFPKVNNHPNMEGMASIRSQVADFLRALPEKAPAHVGDLFILGDSYSTFEGWIPEGNHDNYTTALNLRSDVTRVEQTWWHQLMGLTDARLVLNDSYSGSTICHTTYGLRYDPETSFLGRFRKWKAAGFFDTHPVDTLLIFGGTNDEWAGAPHGEVHIPAVTEEDNSRIYPALDSLLKLAKETLPNARIIFMINSMFKDTYRADLAAVCEENGIPVLKLHDVEMTFGHPIEAGMTAIANQTHAFLERL